jgi:hypothetical protein
VYYSAYGAMEKPRTGNGVFKHCITNA